MSLEKIFEKICKPDPKAVKTPEESIILFQRNKTTLVFLIMLFLMRIIRMILIQSLTTGLHLVMSTTLSIIIFMIVCRSYRWIFTTLFVVSCIFVPLFAKSHQGTTMSNIEGTFIMSVCTIILTQSIKISTVVFTVRMLQLNWIDKQMFMNILKEMSSEEIAEKYISTINFFLPVMFIATAIGYNTLIQNLSELAKAKVTSDTALSQFKTFLLGISHEIRNPINSLLGNLYLLLDEPMSYAAKDMVSTSKICAELLLQLINNILDSGKIEAGNFQVQSNPTNIYELTSKIWISSSELIKRKNLSCCLKMASDVPPMIMLDPYRMTQILLNLIGNAVKFTDKGSINLTIEWLEDLEVADNNAFMPIPYDQDEEPIFEKKSATLSRSFFSTLSLTKREFYDKEMEHYPELGQKGILKIIISDTGCGMAKDEISKLFQKFSQVSQDSAMRQIGTGLGLYITKQIVKKMDGDIRAYSLPNAGTTLITCIPTFYSPSFRKKLDRNQAIETLSLKNLIGIAVDDADFNLSLMEQYFAKFNGKIIGKAHNGEEGFKLFMKLLRQDVKFDLVIADLNMPVLSGKELCEKIRSYEDAHGLKRVFILIISGYDNENEIKTLLDQNGKYKANYFLKKPVDLEHLIDVLSNYYIPESSGSRQNGI